MIKYKVNIAIWGHVHTYERTCGIENFICADDDNDKPVHLVIGSAGNVYNSLWSAYLPESGPMGDPERANHHENPDWSVFRTMDFGYTRIFADQESLKVEYVSNMRGAGWVIVYHSISIEAFVLKSIPWR
jgi:hypothetical protein